MSVAEAQREIDSQEFASWMAYDRIDPFGEQRADLRGAVVAMTVANANRGKGTKAFTIEDFMPRFDQPKRQTPEEMQAVLFAFAEAHNRSIEK